MREQDVGRSWVDTLRWIQVDLRGLREFAEVLRSDVDDNLRTQGSDFVQCCRSGVPFGWQANGVSSVQLAQQQYRECASAGADGLLSYIDAAEAMIAAALEVATRYGSADELARARADEVTAALAGAHQRMLDERLELVSLRKSRPVAE